MIQTNFIHITILLAAFVCSACSVSRHLVDTPTLYTQSTGYPSESFSPIHKTTTPEILFVTDRQPEISHDGTLFLGNKRSDSMSFGIAKIAFGTNLTWKELNRASSVAKRNRDVLLSLADTKEIIRFPETPLPFSVQDDMIIVLPEIQAAYQKATLTMRSVLQRRLADTQKKDVILFIHGVNNNFNEAALSMADLWHFTGRIGVPIFFTWPAANSGLFGYFKDRESGEFSIFHLKETLRILAKTPEIERIHVIAHSRGTDITTSALRELVIEKRAAGKNPRQALKIENLILAAPDLDFGIVTQRLIAEKFGPAIGQITVYMNPDDEALSISQFLISLGYIPRPLGRRLVENQ